MMFQVAKIVSNRFYASYLCSLTAENELMAFYTFIFFISSEWWDKAQELEVRPLCPQN